MTINTGPVSPAPGPGSASLSGDPLGTGVAFPFAPDPVTGSLDWLSGAPLVRQSIKLILGTEPTERVMRPTFGAGLGRYVMDPNTPATRAQIALGVQAALQTWEPRIEVTSVVVEPGTDPAEVLVIVTYVHLSDLTSGSVDVTVRTAGTPGGSP
jgi:phage baseplate assembly protein W